jgi:hypothetical protein
MLKEWSEDKRNANAGYSRRKDRKNKRKRVKMQEKRRIDKRKGKGQVE